jgi:hypothetical protein
VGLVPKRGISTQKTATVEYAVAKVGQVWKVIKMIALVVGAQMLNTQMTAVVISVKPHHIQRVVIAEYV